MNDKLDPNLPSPMPQRGNMRRLVQLINSPSSPPTLRKLQIDLQMQDRPKSFAQLIRNSLSYGHIRLKDTARGTHFGENTELDTVVRRATLGEYANSSVTLHRGPSVSALAYLNVSGLEWATRFGLPAASPTMIYSPELRHLKRQAEAARPGEVVFGPPLSVETSSDNRRMVLEMVGASLALMVVGFVAGGIAALQWLGG